MAATNADSLVVRDRFSHHTSGASGSDTHKYTNGVVKFHRVVVGLQAHFRGGNIHIIDEISVVVLCDGRLCGKITPRA